MILIVDDNSENIFSLKALLEINQYEIDTASSGEEALKKILKKTYSLIILDVQMPEMDGFEVAEAISGYSKSKDIPIIFLSAVNTHKKFITKGYTSGGIDYVTKPFDPDILLLKIKTFYKLSEQTRELNELSRELRQEIELRKQAENILEKKVRDRTKELLASNQKLQESNRELEQFAFIASHDLQEPLRKIQIFSNLALERHLDEKEKLKAYIRRISDSAGRLRTLITDLLDYSKIYIDDRVTSIDLNKIVQEVVSDLEYQMTERNATVVVSDLPEIEGIASQIRQVFQNLLSNAIKFSRDDAKNKIHIDSEIINSKNDSNHSGKYCRITIRDKGIGFSNEFRTRIFEIFQRLHDKKTYEGTGIGLSIVKKIVERHGGTISATGEENSGATFTVILPLKK